MPYDYQNLVPLSGKDRTGKILEHLLSAASLADVHLPGILDITKQIILKFRSEQYSNRWLFNQKTIKNLGKVGLECELDKDNFSLCFFLKAKDRVIFKKMILETKPDSLCYHYQFNKLVIEDNYILVPSRYFHIRDKKYQYFSEKFPNILYKTSLADIEEIFYQNVLH